KKNHIKAEIMSKKTILITCFSITSNNQPNKYMCLNLINQIAYYQKVIVITQASNQQLIEKYVKKEQNPSFTNITFLYFDLPRWLFLTQKSKHGPMLYYYMWQRELVPFIKKQSLYFDVVHNINPHYNWEPSFLRKLNKPLAWGPTSFHPDRSANYFDLYSKKMNWLQELRWLLKTSKQQQHDQQKVTHYNSYIWSINPKSPSKSGLQKNIFSINNMETSFYEDHKKAKNKSIFNVLSIGDFNDMNEYNLVVNAFIAFVDTLPDHLQQHCTLTVILPGREKNSFSEITKQKNPNQAIQIKEWYDSSPLKSYYEKADVFLFPVQEQGEQIIKEALSFALPIIIIQNKNSRHFMDNETGIAIHFQNYKDTLIEVKLALLKLYKIPHLTKKMSNAAKKKYDNKQFWEMQSSYLQNLYKSIAS
ncbi:MAG: glycosyltransferase, partial [Flavobacterium sp.]